MQDSPDCGKMMNKKIRKGVRITVFQNSLISTLLKLGKVLDYETKRKILKQNQCFIQHTENQERDNYPPLQ